MRAAFLHRAYRGAVSSARSGLLPYVLPSDKFVLWTLAGAGGAYQLAVAAAFLQAPEPVTKASAFGGPRRVCARCKGSASWPAGR